MEYFAWPLAAVAIATISLLIFKAEIASFINRIHKLETPLGKFSGPEQQGPDVAAQTLGTPHEGQKDEPVTPIPGGPLNALSRPIDLSDRVDPIFRKFHEKRIMEDPEYAGEPDHKKREALLVRYLAAITMLWDFEIIYRVIFGSQISALRHLGTNRDPVVISSLRAFYDQAKEKYPELYSDYEFEPWFEFLVSRNVVFVEGDKVAIDMKGIAFLKFLAEFRYTDHRVY